MKVVTVGNNHDFLQLTKFIFRIFDSMFQQIWKYIRNQ